MKTIVHKNNLIQLTFYGFVNVYLVDEEDGFTVVDTAMERCAGGIVMAAQKAGKTITRILLTHAHIDHIGGLDALHALVPEAEVIMPARDARFLAGDMRLDADEPQDRLRGGWVLRETVPSRLIQEGDRIGSLEAILTPGHTPGHTSFLDTRDRTLIAGDTYQTLGVVAVAGKLTTIPLLTWTTWHKGLALESARKLRLLEPTRLAPGHGHVLEQPLAAMDRAIEQAAHSLEQTGQVHTSKA